MNAKCIFQSLILCTLITLLAGAAQAQSGVGGGNVVEFKKRQLEQIGAATRNSINENAAGAQTAELQVAAEGGILDVLERQKKALAGSYLVDVKITAPPEFAADLKALTAFTEDGLFIGTLQGDTIPPINSPAIGSWAHLGGRSFAVTFRVVVYDPENTLIGVAKIRGTCTLDETGNGWSGRFKYEVIAPNGSVLIGTEGPWQATRIKVEPLN
jgi:hypothetical protein